HAWDEPGQYTVTVTAHLTGGGTDSYQRRLVVVADRPAHVSWYSNDVYGLHPGDTAQFTGSASDPDEGGSATEYAWNWGDGTPVTTSGTSGASHSWADLGTYDVTLTVTFSTGEVASYTDLVRVRESEAANYYI